MLDFTTDASLFGVFDGLGGPEIARYAAHRLPQLIKAKYLETGAYETALKYAFKELDGYLLHLDSQVQSLGTQVPQDVFEQEEPYEKEPFKELLLAVSSKSATAIIILLTKTKIFIGNIGTGGCAISEGESVNLLTSGNSRMLGACKNKRQLSQIRQQEAARPDVLIITVKPNIHDFMVITCDGKWTSLNGQTAITFIQEQMQLPNTSMDLVCENLMSKCLVPSYFLQTGKDNMTFLIVKFKRVITKSLPIDIIDNRDERERRKPRRPHPDAI